MWRSRIPSGHIFCHEGGAVVGQIRGWTGGASKAEVTDLWGGLMSCKDKKKQGGHLEITVGVQEEV